MHRKTHFSRSPRRHWVPPGSFAQKYASRASWRRVEASPMISRTHSGNLQPGERPSAATIVETLGGGSAIGLYALCCAERLSVVAEQLAGTPLIRRRVLVALELGWAVAVGHYRDAQAISTALADLDSYIGLDSNL